MDEMLIFANPKTCFRTLTVSTVNPLDILIAFLESISDLITFFGFKFCNRIQDLSVLGGIFFVFTSSTPKTGHKNVLIIAVANL